MGIAGGMTTSGRAVPGADSSVCFFDRRAYSYDRELNDPTPAGYALRIRREKAVGMFDKAGGKVLDVGCGPGVMARRIMDLGCSFWGVDLSEKMLEICRNRFPANDRLRFLKRDATHLGFPDDFFDAVLCMGVIDAVGDGRGAVREMLRVLKPGGTLLITFTNRSSPYSWWKKAVFYPAVTRYHKFLSLRGQTPAHLPPPVATERTLYQKREACGLLQLEGAEILQTMGYYFNLFLAPLDEMFPSLALWVTKKFEEGRWPRAEWMASGWIIKARKIDDHSKTSGPME